MITVIYRVKRPTLDFAPRPYSLRTALFGRRSNSRLEKLQYYLTCTVQSYLPSGAVPHVKNVMAHTKVTLTRTTMYSGALELTVTLVDIGQIRSKLQ